MAKKITKPEPQLLKVDLACGQNKQEGFVGVDIVNMKNVDIVHDLDQTPWPFEDNSVDEAYCSRYVEHTKCLMKFMNELYRILKPGAKCTILALYYSSMQCRQDPTHIRAISEGSFLYYNKEWREENKLDHYPITADFDFSYDYSLLPEWANQAEDARNFAIRHYLNVVTDIHVVLVKK